MTEPAFLHSPDSGDGSRAPGGTASRLRLLTVTTLFPNAVMPNHGIFVENRLRHLAGRGGIELTVIAPVPWFPFRSRMLGRYARWARVPPRERRHGVAVSHPRYLVLPKIGMVLQPYFLYRAFLKEARRLQRQGLRFDLIDAHYYYPDGVAAALLSRRLGRPFIVTARGTDLNLVPRFALPRAMIRWTAARAAASITVCQALKDALIDLGTTGRIQVLRNGVDLGLFRPLDRASLRAAQGLTGPVALSVGHLVERKGHHLVIEALGTLPGLTLLVAGDGPERRRLEATARRAGVAHRVRFLGNLPHERLPEIYNLADVLVLASSREGWANVLLEAMACGTPVVASRIWGTPEVVTEPAAGLLVERSAEAIALGLRRLLADPPDRAATRAFAERFSWDATTEGQIRLFEEVLGPTEESRR